jgi:hypothetical protein
MRKLLATVIAVAMFITGCDDSQLRKANRAVAGVSSGLVALQAANQTAFQAGEIDKESAKVIANVAIEASLVNDQAVAHLRSLKKLDAQSAEQLLAYVNQISLSLENLQAFGVLHFKSDAARLKFEASIVAVQGSLTIAQGLLQGVK